MGAYSKVKLLRWLQLVFSQVSDICSVRDLAGLNIYFR